MPREADVRPSDEEKAAAKAKMLAAERAAQTQSRNALGSARFVCEVSAQGRSGAIKSLKRQLDKLEALEKDYGDALRAYSELLAPMKKEGAS